MMMIAQTPVNSFNTVNKVLIELPYQLVDVGDFSNNNTDFADAKPNVPEEVEEHHVQNSLVLELKYVNSFARSDVLFDQNSVLIKSMYLNDIFIPPGC